MVAIVARWGGDGQRGRVEGAQELAGAEKVRELQARGVKGESRLSERQWQQCRRRKLCKMRRNGFGVRRSVCILSRERTRTSSDGGKRVSFWAGTYLAECQPGLVETLSFSSPAVPCPYALTPDTMQRHMRMTRLSA